MLELIDSKLEVDTLLFTIEFEQAHSEMDQLEANEQFEVPVKLLESIGTLKTNDQAIAIVKTLPNEPIPIGTDEYALVLDDVRDPGNVGTIIRIADWYGIDKIIASETTAEVYNPKVISSSKGSFTRVRLYYTDLVDYLSGYSGAIYGALMEGENVHSVSFDRAGLIVMGNESNGISKSVQKLVNQRITIPRFGEAESLNVAIATAVICDNLRR